MLIKSIGSQSRRRGIALVLVVVSLVALMGVLAVSLEGGMLLTERRNAQATADAAAMAAAADLYYNFFVDFGADSAGTAKAAAFNVAALNGYNNDGVETIVTVNIPPLTGPYAGKLSYAEVIVETFHTRGFSAIFGADRLPIRARAVSVGKPSAAEVGILVLDPDEKSAFNANGGADITVNKVAIVVNSTSQEGSISGGGATVAAPEYHLVGNYTTTGGGTFTGQMNVNGQPMEDPLKWLPQPDKSRMIVQQHNQQQYTSGTTVLYPGVYRGGISASASANIVMMPGIYYMDRGGFKFTGSGSLFGENVMIYNEPGNGQSNGIDLSAGGNVKLTPPSTGIYKGILLFQDRNADVTASISGGSNMDITGTFYFANSLLSITGHSDFINVGSQYVSRMMNVQGTGRLYVDWSADRVAQVRLITIVE